MNVSRVRKVQNLSDFLLTINTYALNLYYKNLRLFV